MDKKYELTDETIEIDGLVGYRIRAVRAFGEIQPGDLGGFVASDETLSHDGECWIYPDAVALENSRVVESAELHDNAVLMGNALVAGMALIHDAGQVVENARVDGATSVGGYACIAGNAHVSCGEDGPHILNDCYIDFDVHYGLDYVLIGTSYEAHQFSVSQSGRISSIDFSGTIDELRAWAEEQAKENDDNEIGRVVTLAEAALASFE